MAEPVPERIVPVHEEAANRSLVVVVLLSLMAGLLLPFLLHMWLASGDRIGIVLALLILSPVMAAGTGLAAWGSWRRVLKLSGAMAMAGMLVGLPFLREVPPALAWAAALLGGTAVAMWAGPRLPGSPAEFLGRSLFRLLGVGPMLFARFLRLRRGDGPTCRFRHCGLADWDPMVVCVACGGSGGGFKVWPRPDRPFFAVCPGCRRWHPVWRAPDYGAGGSGRLRLAEPDCPRRRGRCHQAGDPVDVAVVVTDDFLLPALLGAVDACVGDARSPVRSAPGKPDWRPVWTEAIDARAPLPLGPGPCRMDWPGVSVWTVSAAACPIDAAGFDGVLILAGTMDGLDASALVETVRPVAAPAAKAQAPWRLLLGLGPTRQPGSGRTPPFAVWPAGGTDGERMVRLQEFLAASADRGTARPPGR
ncbi:MAG TPA: hypothetical protein VEB20_19125 [Azospirillaceae bacterium]|nr:hypothetical protein [Azospirillaceae bacterium]